MITRTCSAGYDWCDGAGAGLQSCDGDHGKMTYQRATLGEGAPYRGDAPLMIGIGIRFNTADGDVAPRVIIHVDGGPEQLDVEVNLRPGEAYEVGKLLDNAIMDATSATLSLLPARLANDLLEVE